MSPGTVRIGYFSPPEKCTNALWKRAAIGICVWCHIRAALFGHTLLKRTRTPRVKVIVWTNPVLGRNEPKRHPNGPQDMWEDRYRRESQYTPEETKLGFRG